MDALYFYFLPVMSHDSSRVSRRFNLFQKLASLPNPQFETVLFALKPPVGNVPSAAASQGDRVAALLEWAESIGCGLDQIETVYLLVAYPR